MTVEYASGDRGPGTFPRRWGPVPSNFELRCRWIAHHCESEQGYRAGRDAALRERQLFYKRLKP